MTALIVDDERLARRELRRLLAEGHPEVRVVGEAANAREALARLAEGRPDLMFLDVQMPGQSGFELLASLPASRPRVIFVTAHDEHALRAFEFHPFDYLLKPVDPARLAASLGALARPENFSPADDLAPPPPVRPLRADDHILVKIGARGLLARVGEVRLVAAEGNGCRLFLGDHAQAVVPRSLHVLHGRLDPALFFQASRQHLVNLRWVTAVEPWFSGGVLLRLRGEGDLRVEVSRRRAQAFRERTAL